MKTSRDPLQPLRCWKELFLGERAFKSQKDTREQRRELDIQMINVSVDHAMASH